MSDDWRLRVDLHEGGHARSLTGRFEAGELEHDLESEFHDRVVVSRDGAEVFLYAGSREQAEAAGKLINSLAAGRAGSSTPSSGAGTRPRRRGRRSRSLAPDDDAAEHARLIAAERDQLRRTGTPEFEVRVEGLSRADAERVVARLPDEGRPSVHGSTYVLAAATDEDDAAALADRLRSESPDGCASRSRGPPRPPTRSGPRARSRSTGGWRARRVGGRRARRTAVARAGGGGLPARAATCLPRARPGDRAAVSVSSAMVVAPSPPRRGARRVVMPGCSAQSRLAPGGSRTWRCGSRGRTWSGGSRNSRAGRRASTSGAGAI